MIQISSFAASTRRVGLLRQVLTIAAIHLSLSAAAFANVIYTSGGFDEARGCAASQDTCVRNGRISDARQSGSEVASAFRLSSAAQLTGLSWIGDHFDGDRFMFRLYGSEGGSPTNDPLYEFNIGESFTTTPLVASPGFLSGWQLNATIAPILLEANKSYFASLSVSGAANSILTYSWDLGKGSNGSGDYRRDDFTGGWEGAGPQVAAYQLAGVNVPEPATFALLVPALAVVWVYRRRRTAAV